MTTKLLHLKKDWVQAKACRGDWAGVLPTQKLLETNLATPENVVQKLFMIFCYMDGRTDGRTDGQTPYKTNHTSSLNGCGKKFFNHSQNRSMGSQVVSLHAFYSDDPSSNPSFMYSICLKNCVGKELK